MPKFSKLLGTLAVVALSIGFLATIYFGALAFWPDSAPPADAAMLPKWKEHSGTGPLADFQIWLRSHPVNLSSYERLKKKETWNAEDAEKCVQKNREALEKFTAFMKSNPGTWSVVDASAISLGRPFESIEPLSNLAALELIHIRSLANKNQFSEAASEAQKLVHFGQGLEGAEGTLIHRLVALSAVEKGIDGFSAIAESGGGSIQDWSEWESFLAKAEPKEDELLHACQVEYLSFKRMIEDVKKEGIDLGALSDGDTANPRRGKNMSYFLKPNATAQRYLDLLQPILDAHRKHQGWAPVQEAASGVDDRLFKVRSRWTILFSMNATGNIVLTLAMPAYKQLFLREYSVAAKVRQAACNIGLRRYELAEGKLPNDLSQLVPKYLPSVPLDPFDLKPMKWNPKTLVIYALGENMKDDGGAIERDNHSRPKDVGLHYWWWPTGK